jgi:pseudaminic acid cytidylyltransferase
LAIIPARGGSKRIPGKNIRDFCGKPMIAYVLNTAQKSDLFDTIHVSTEDNKIFDLVSILGFQPDFKRIEELADDKTPIMPVLKYVTESFLAREQFFDEIWVLMATTPLLKTKSLILAAELMKAHESKQPIIAVNSYPVPIEWAFKRRQDGMLTPNTKGSFAIRSQDLQTHYYDSGTFAAYPVNMILASEGAGDEDKFLGYILPNHQAVDIDTNADWQLAEILYRGTLAVKEKIT